MSDSSITSDHDEVERLARDNLEIIAGGDFGAIDASAGARFWDMQGRAPGGAA